uniref:uncharacterized protein LOC120337292 isoform X1 n=1 Tax=Styela clava TaxID=7725 RepID=UPI00193AC6FD|nr:uncharacterized protein LOC120337292 isoform X1 [Styela clava]
MTLLQRISRSARNALLLCPRSLRLGGRKRSLNILIFIVLLFTCTVYITEKKSVRTQLEAEPPKLEKRAHIEEEQTEKVEQPQQQQQELEQQKQTPITSITSTSILLATSPIVKKEIVKKVDVTRQIEAVAENKEKDKISQKSLEKCKKRSPKLVGDMKSNPNITPSMEEVAKHVGPGLSIGGCYSPKECIALQKVAVIIPFKDRDAHLKTLLYHLHPMLMRQHIHYCIYVAEQFDNGQFNKATVMNAAFEEALKLDDYDCIIFHDVDMIPENDRNFYMCADQPRHLSPAIDKFQYKPHYGTEFGGVTGITPSQYRKANGHSNRFWGWGGEDNDMEFRIQHRNMTIVPSSLKVGRYMMIPHLHPWKFSPNKYPFKLNLTRKTRADIDGLSDLQYRLLEVKRFPMYTKLIIDIRRIQVTKLTLYIDGRASMDIDLYPDDIDIRRCRWETYINKTLEKHDRIDDSDYSYPNLTAAKSACDKMQALCGGIVKEVNGIKYTLRKKGPPKHSDKELTRLIMSRPNVRLMGALGNDMRLGWMKLRKQAASGDFVINKDGKHQIGTDTRLVLDPSEVLEDGVKRIPTLNEVLAKNTTAYVKYCPGFYGAHQSLPKPLKQTIPPDITKWVNENEGNHFRHYFAFKIDIEVVLNPSEYLYYTDEKHFESHLEKGENHYTFTWPGKKTPNFSNPDIPKKYSFRTPDFAIPNIPGTYAVESKIVDKYRQPYFQWNWWFEVTSGDPVVDARTRDVYWKKKMTENMIRSKAQRHEEVMKEKARRQRQNQAEYERKMAELKQHPNKPKPPVVHRDGKSGMPEGIAKLMEKVQKAVNNGEENPMDMIDTHDPVFQRNVGKIQEEENDHDAEPRPTLIKTTKKKLVRVAVNQKQFHIQTPKKKKEDTNNNIV